MMISLVIGAANLFCSGVAKGSSVPRTAHDHEPIGVMGGHLHPKGETMIAYRYVRTNMNGNQDGKSSKSVGSVLLDYPNAPYDMDMEMHIFGFMRGLSDNTNLVGMFPLIRKDMKHRVRMGGGFTSRTNGIGDMKLSILSRIKEWDHKLLGYSAQSAVIMGAGLSFPTGSINEKDAMPMGRSRLPYPMQISSGTYDLLPSILYKGLNEKFAWGLKVEGVLPTGINNKGYRLGNRFTVTSWLQYAISRVLGSSFRLKYEDWGNIRGDDDLLNPSMTPGGDPNLRSGRRIDALFGINVLKDRGVLPSARLSMEIGRPVFQDLSGPQLAVDWTFIAGIQYTFK